MRSMWVLPFALMVSVVLAIGNHQPGSANPMPNPSSRGLAAPRLVKILTGTTVRQGDIVTLYGSGFTKDTFVRLDDNDPSFSGLTVDRNFPLTDTTISFVLKQAYTDPRFGHRPMFDLKPGQHFVAVMGPGGKSNALAFTIAAGTSTTPTQPLRPVTAVEYRQLKQAFEHVLGDKSSLRRPDGVTIGKNSQGFTYMSATRLIQVKPGNPAVCSGSRRTDGSWQAYLPWTAEILALLEQ